MQLVAIDNAMRGTDEGGEKLILALRAIIYEEVGEEAITGYCYRPSDPFGLSPQIKAYLVANPVPIFDAPAEG